MLKIDISKFSDDDRMLYYQFKQLHSDITFCQSETRKLINKRDKVISNISSAKLKQLLSNEINKY